MPYRVGEQVTILPPYDRDPVIIEHQHHVRIAQRTDAGYLVELEAVFPPGERFGPFPAERLAPGWRDRDGRWRP